MARSVLLPTPRWPKTPTRWGRHIRSAGDTAERGADIFADLTLAGDNVLPFSILRRGRGHKASSRGGSSSAAVRGPGRGGGRMSVAEAKGAGGQRPRALWVGVAAGEVS